MRASGARVQSSAHPCGDTQPRDGVDRDGGLFESERALARAAADRRRERWRA
jgi:hypothetical protein